MCMQSKCAGCDQRKASIYHDEDMYCEDCFEEHLMIEECYCDDDKGIVCYLHIEGGRYEYIKV